MFLLIGATLQLSASSSEDDDNDDLVSVGSLNSDPLRSSVFVVQETPAPRNREGQNEEIVAEEAPQPQVNNTSIDLSDRKQLII